MMTSEDITRIKRGPADLEEIIKKQRARIEELEKDREILKIQQESHNNYIKGFEEGKRVYNLIVEEKQKLIEKQERDIEILKPKEHLNTNQKGDEFEDMITTELIQKTDRFAYVEDTSNIKGSGDRICVFNDFKIMVECKHKNSITKQDIEQFKDHYMSDIRVDKYHIAIMLAYSTNNIIEKGSWKIERYLDNNVIGYLTISKDYKREQVEQIIITFVEQVIDYYGSLKEKKETVDENELMYTMLNDIHRDILYIEKYELKQIENIQTRYKEKQRLFQNYIDQCELKNIPIPMELQSSTISTDIFMNKLMDKISSTNLDDVDTILHDRAGGSQVFFVADIRTSSTGNSRGSNTQKSKNANDTRCFGKSLRNFLNKLRPYHSGDDRMNQKSNKIFDDLKDNKFEIGDQVICQTAAVQGASVIGDFVTVQANIDVATTSTVGLVSVPSAGGIDVSGAGAISLDSQSSSGSYGAVTKTLTATVDGKGIVTAMAESNIAIPASQITDFWDSSAFLVNS